jgi:hypothetical protein
VTAWMKRRPLLAALAGIAMLLAVAVGLELAFGVSSSNADGAPARAAAPPDAKLLPPVVAQAPDLAFPEMAARPLFTPTRRPAPPDPTAGRGSFTRGQFVLQGVITDGDQRTAMLKEKATGRVFRVDRGKDVNGIVVERIEPTEVTLAMGGEHESLALLVQRLDGKVVPGAPAGAAPAESPGPFGGPPAAPAAAPGAPGAPQAQGAPLAAAPAARSAPGTPLPPSPANPAATGGSQPTAQPMSPEELLARRRARRNQTPQ